MGYPVSPVIANIYMEYLEKLALCPKCVIHTHWLKRNVDVVISIVKKEQVDTPFNHLNSVDPHIKFTMEASGIDGSISLLNTKCSPNSDHTIHTSIERKPTNTNHYLDWNCSHPISARKAVIHALIDRAKKFFQLLKSWLKMDYLYRDLLKKLTKIGWPEKLKSKQLPS